MDALLRRAHVMSFSAFAIPNILQFDESNDFPRVLVTTPQANAELYLHGAHLTRYQPTNAQPVLFTSRDSEFSPQSAIRGGVPIIFPWFGDWRGASSHAAALAHGFARRSAWKLVKTTQNENSVTVELRLQSSDLPPDAWPEHNDAKWSLRYRVTVGATLHLELETHNEGESAFNFEQALHTYFAVSDVRQVEIEGLNETEYLDKTDGMKRKRQTSPLQLTSETDRVYVSTTAACELRDPDWKRQIVVEKSGSDSTILWNPWEEKARAMKDLADDEWLRMLCIESGNVGENALTLNAGETHTLGVAVSVRGL